MEDTLVQMMRNAEGYDEERSAPAVWGGYLALTLTSVAAGLYPWLKRWAVILWGVFLFLASALVSIYSPLCILEGLYAICCAMMCEFAHMFGMKYPEVCVLEQLFLHPLILVLFALPAFLVSVKGYFFGGRRHVAPLLLSSFMLAVNVAIMVVSWWHYWGGRSSLLVNFVASSCRKWLIMIGMPMSRSISSFSWSIPCRRDYLLVSLPICEKEVLVTASRIREIQQAQ